MSERAAMGDEVRQALLAEEGGRRWLRRGILGLVLAALIVGGLVARAKSRPPPAARYMTAEASVGDVVEKVLAAVIMFACAIGLAVSGILMANGGENDTLEELHELLANIFLISVIIHVAGIVFHHLKKRDSLWSSMLDGKKKTSSDAPGIAGTRPVAGLLLMVLFVSWLGYLATNYNSSAQTLNILGTELRLGEAEHETEGGYGEHGEEHDDD